MKIFVTLWNLMVQNSTILNDLDLHGLQTKYSFPNCFKIITLFFLDSLKNVFVRTLCKISMHFRGEEVYVNYFKNFYQGYIVSYFTKIIHFIEKLHRTYNYAKLTWNIHDPRWHPMASSMPMRLSLGHRVSSEAIHGPV